MLRGHDVVAQVSEGRGASTAIVIGMLGRIDHSRGACQGVIVVATRELAQKAQKTVLALGDYLKVRSIAWVLDHHRDYIDSIREGCCHIVVTTLPRLHSIICRRKLLKVEDLSIIAFDQVDEMVSRGYSDYLHEVAKVLPATIQRCIFSSTEEAFPWLVKSDEAVQVLIKDAPTPQLSLINVRHYYIAIEKEEWKLDTLCDLYETLPGYRTIVYCNTRRKMDFLHDHLTKRDFTSVSQINSDTGERERTSILGAFRSGTSDILLSTDLPAPIHCDCIHSNDVAYVLNYDLPTNIESYLVRGGHIQPGRATNVRPIIINFVTNSDVRQIKDVEKHYRINIEEMPMDIADHMDEPISFEEQERQQFVAADPRTM
jgi:translation initiation factor 4A